MKYFDTHAHYNDDAYKDNLDLVLNKCLENNVEYIVNVGYNVASSKKAVELAQKYPYIYAALGVHPHDVKTDTAQDVYDLYNSIDTSKVKAIGEIGLDYHYVSDNKEAQKKLFIEQIELANYLNLPILIHSRDASLDTYTVLKENKPKAKTLLHCFQPSDDLVRLVLDNGYSVAFGGNITYKRNKKFYEYINMIPISQIVIETDCPYLSPEPYRGTVNTSANLPIICRKLAELKNMDEKETAQIVFDNSLKFFNL